ncbi:MAG: hypothetical protein K2L54_04810, partial [Clostridiales bacterium]|nr:hypothetical protein [Clostridiales bacterium]
NTVTVPAGRTFTFTNVANGVTYTATTGAGGGLAFKNGETAVTEILALPYVVTSAYCEPVTADVTASGATIAVTYKTVSITTNVITDNTRDINLNAPVGMSRVLAYERWISQWDTAIDTMDDSSLLNGCKYWTLSGTETAYPNSTTYGPITSAGGYRIKGLQGQEEYDDWAPIINS